MLVFTCTTETNPCPPSEQVWISLETLLDPALVGITPELVLKVISWGFGFVLSSFLIGWLLSIAVGMVRKF
ncbi:hypothetical protein J1N44_14925 [Acidovorax temperans]|uniref:hypothetical protein n=1 Tax=Acidovorax temperans TaxID=80878 RepID=UPI001A945CFD|nr:hypothetical protein [Acidovorax temperans]MBO0942958.1 hypothetical protein [Acidovorax temperans]